MSLLAIPSRVVLILAVALLPAHLCCCLTEPAQASQPVAAATPAADDHDCCGGKSAEESQPTNHRDSCDCVDTQLTAPDDAPALVAVHAAPHVFDLPLIPAALLHDLASPARTPLTSLDTPPPLDARTLRAVRCVHLL